MRTKFQCAWRGVQGRTTPNSSDAVGSSLLRKLFHHFFSINLRLLRQTGIVVIQLFLILFNYWTEYLQLFTISLGRPFLTTALPKSVWWPFGIAPLSKSSSNPSFSQTSWSSRHLSIYCAFCVLCPKMSNDLLSPICVLFTLASTELNFLSLPGCTSDGELMSPIVILSLFLHEALGSYSLDTQV